MLKTNFSGHNKFVGLCSLVATGLKEVLMIKVLPEELSETMNNSVYVVNFFEARALN